MSVPLLALRGVRKAFGPRVLFEIDRLAVEEGGA